tara:strand:- start:1468 stop:1776 length:309 start_codon:yes stop_codon:yes gene_type:complete
MNEVRYVKAKYETNINYDLDDIAKEKGFNVADIIRVETGKWATLEILLKDGNSFYIQHTPNGDETDWKWATKEYFYTEDFSTLDTEDVKYEMEQAVNKMEDY